jgi:hypothetical protein
MEQNAKVITMILYNEKKKELKSNIRISNFTIICRRNSILVVIDHSSSSLAVMSISACPIVHRIINPIL